MVVCQYSERLNEGWEDTTRAKKEREERSCASKACLTGIIRVTLACGYSRLACKSMSAVPAAKTANVDTGCGGAGAKQVQGGLRL